MKEPMTQTISWQATINETYQELTQQIISSAPQIIGAIALLAVGYITAFALRMLAQKLVQGFDSIFNRAVKNDGVKREQLKKSYSLIIGKFVFWIVFIFFIAASANLLGWKLFSGLMEELLSFLPSVVSGLVIILGGYLISNAARSGIISTSMTIGTITSHALARIAQIVILFSFIIIGIEQIGLNVQFLTSAIVVIVGILLAGGVLAFSLGAKTMVANIIGAQHTRKHCSVGEHMKFGELEGEVLEVTQTSIVLDTKQGRAIIPAKYFHEEIILLNPESNTDKPSTDIQK